MTDHRAAGLKAAATRRRNAQAATPAPSVEGVYTVQGCAGVAGALTTSAPIISMRIVREATQAAPATVTGPKDVVNLLRERYADCDREVLVVVILDTKGQVLAINPVCVGSINTVPVTMREVFKAAVILGAASIIVAHNHPSGDPTPSPEDVSVTRKMIEAGQLLGIDVLDHIVLGAHGRYTSMSERRLGFTY